MSATVFYEGAAEFATLTNTFAVAGTSTDPTTVTLVVTDPTGTATTYTHPATLTKTGTGVYTKDVPCTVAGLWTYTWIGTGAASDVEAGTWTVFSTELNKLYCSVEELKSRLGVTSTADNSHLRMAVETASRWVDGRCRRYFWRGTDTRAYVPCGSYGLLVDDLVSVTTLKTDDATDGTYGTTWAASDYQLLPVNAAAMGELWPYTEIRAVGTRTIPLPSTTAGRQHLVQVTGVFGWPAVPAPVKEATLIMAADYFKQKDAPFGVAGFGDYGVVRVRDNPKAAELLESYENPARVGV